MTSAVRGSNLTAQLRGGIPPDEVQLHPFSAADASGQLFTWKGQLFRALRPEASELFEAWFSQGLISEWSRRGFIPPTEITELTLPGFRLILKHTRVEPVSFPPEWPAPMFRDAILHELDFGLELARRGLLLKDPHPWNVLFDGTSPVYVDLTSIIPRPEGTIWPGFRNFSRFCYHPLLLMSEGHDRLARLLMQEDGGVDGRALARLVGSQPTYPLRSWERTLRAFLCRMAGTPAAEDSTTIVLRRLKRRIERIRLPESAGPSQSDTGNRGGSPERGRNGPGPKRRRESHETEPLVKFVEAAAPREVLDINCVSTDFPTSVAKAGIKVVAFSADPQVAAALYGESKAGSLPVLPLVVDFRCPTASRGLGENQSISAERRFRSDLVVARALSVGLLREGRLRLDQLATGLSAFAEHRLLIEFDDQGEGAGGAIESLGDALRPFFPKVQVVWNEPSSLIICQR